MTPSETPAPVVLFVDADILVRSAVGAYLRECGYIVIEAASTDEAIAVLGRPEIDLDIVVLDVDTPGAVDGFGLARWAAEHRRDVRVVLAATVQRMATLAADLCKDGPQLRVPYDHTALLDFIKRLRIER